MYKLLVITNGLAVGGAEKQTVSLLNGLSQKGFDIVLMSLDSNCRLKSSLAKEIDTEILNKRSFFDLGALRKIRNRIRDFTPEFILLENSYSMLFGFIARWQSHSRARMIMVNHTTIIDTPKERFQNILYSRIMNRMDSLVYVCENQRSYWVGKYKLKSAITEVIHNGIDLEWFSSYGGIGNGNNGSGGIGDGNRDGDIDRSAFREKLGFADNDIVVGISANLRPVKRHQDLIAAAALLVPSLPIKLLFIGDGPQRAFLQEYASQKGLRERLTITGMVDDVRPYMKCIDIFALTSVSETFSMAALEAMAMRKPAILSNVGGASELVESGVNGFLYPAGDAGALAGCIRQTTESGRMNEMGQASFEKVKASFIRENMIEKYIRLMNRLI